MKLFTPATSLRSTASITSTPNYRRHRRRKMKEQEKPHEISERERERGVREMGMKITTNST